MEILQYLCVLAGVANVMLLKWSDTLEGECGDGEWRNFQHPVVQVTLMFLGEFLCFVIYRIAYCLLGAKEENPLICLERELSPLDPPFPLLASVEKKFSPISLVFPALLEAVASLILFTCLYLTYASSFSILQISALVFVGIFSHIFTLKFPIVPYWVAMLAIAFGIACVAENDFERVLNDYYSLPHNDPETLLAANLLIVLTQIIRAIQFLYEENFMKATNMPAMEAAGWQGIFGLPIAAVLGICLSFIHTSEPIDNNTHGVLDDLRDVYTQIHSNNLLLVPLSILIVSYGCHKYTSLGIMKLSSTAYWMLWDRGMVALGVFCMVSFAFWELPGITVVLGLLVVEIGVIFVALPYVLNEEDND